MWKPSNQDTLKRDHFKGKFCCHKSPVFVYFSTLEIYRLLSDTSHCSVTTIIRFLGNPHFSNVFFLQERWQPMDFPCCHLEVRLASVNIPLHNLQVFALQLQYKHTILYCMFVYVQANRDRLSSLLTCMYHVRSTDIFTVTKQCVWH